MAHRISTVALGPILLWQGWRVRCRTPRLPEASGPRTGVAGCGAPLRVLFLGDSSAAGVGVETQESALTGHTLAGLVDGYRVDWELIARTGMTTRGMIDELKARSPGRYYTAVTALGMNDVTGRRSVSDWLKDQRRLWEVLRLQCQVSLIVVSGLPPVHAFLAFPQPLRWYLASYAARLDRALFEATEHQNDCHFVSLCQIPGSSVTAADGLHPGALSYSRWGGRIAETIRTSV